MDIKDSIVSSALWAAYGDAIGFISELADQSALVKRIGRSAVISLVNWRRRIGGQYGPDINLPAGCYSDDTQLRLATGRAIRSDGTFDVEIFAKIELTIWPTYALGAGRGTKAAAANLVRQDINWFSNFFSSNKSDYTNCGGNGAAMRIQPHIWASTDRGHPKSYLGDVICNSICTHGHFRGILGSVFHALCLAAALESGSEPGPDTWKEAIGYFDKIPSLMRENSYIGTFWIPTWEKKCSRTIEDAINEIAYECMNDIEALLGTMNMKPRSAYQAGLERIGGMRKDTVGSGTKTALLASFLSWLYRHDSPDDALLVAANTLGSDTDTIATMAGAILGASKAVPPVAELMDEAYITKEAERLYAIGIGATACEFVYPDILNWIPPKTQLDTIGLFGNDVVIAGLGPSEAVSDKFYPPSSRSDAAWQWYSLPFGQTVLAKRRSDIRILPPGNFTAQGYRRSQSGQIPCKEIPKSEQETPRSAAQSDRGVARQDEPLSNHTKEHRIEQTSLLQLNSNNETAISSKEWDIDLLTQKAIASNFDERLIGKHLVSLARGGGGVDKAIGYAAIIAKAIATRQRHKK